MSVKWTDEQQQVIDLRNRNILVSAAAGSGKTAVLVERIFSMLTDPKKPLDMDGLLVVTFTNAAAAEMKERVEERLLAGLEQNPDSTLLQKHLASIHNAQITTIHSFCLYVIRNHFNEIDLDPSFRIGEETEFKLLKGDIVSRVLEQYYEEKPAGFTDFIECFSGGKTDTGIEDLILKVYEYSRSYPWPKRWLEKCLECFNVQTVASMEALPALKFLGEYLKILSNELYESLKEALALCREADGPVFYDAAIESDLKFVAALLECTTLSQYEQVFKTLSFPALSRKKMPDVSEEKKNRVKNIREFVKKTLQEIQSSYFYTDMETMAKDIYHMRPVMEILVSLVTDFSRQYQQAKEEKNMVDFGDLEHYALQILVRDQDGVLTPTDAALQLSRQFDEIMIDEYQDSNQVQETILTSVSRTGEGRPNIFMVGDVKQSIYKFRLARPELFMEKYKIYQDINLGDALYQKIDLHKNFRSRAVVLESINFIFRRLMRRNLGDIEYDQDAALYAGLEFPELCPETCPDVAHSVDVLLVTQEQGNDDHNAGKASIQEADSQARETTEKELEAKAVAGKIREMLRGKNPLLVVDKKTGLYRKAKPGDMVILLRTMSGWADIFVKVLGDEGIMAQAETVTGFFSAREVRTVLNYLGIVDNPCQDIALAAVLHSPIGGFDDNEMAMIRTLCRDRGLYESCMSFLQPESDLILERFYSPEQYEPVRVRLQAFFVQLDSFRSIVPFTPIHQLILKIYDETGYYRFISAMPGGEKRRANLDMLVEKAVAYSATSYRGLFNFARYIDKLKKYEVDFGEAPAVGGNDQVVRIMSIHKSKGLEYPIVFVSGLGKSFNQQDARSALIIHPEYGFGSDAVDALYRVKSPTILKKTLARKTVLENLGEELRVLYVALTRAKEKLIMTGYVRDLDRALTGWLSKAITLDGCLSFGARISASCYLDWVMPVIIQAPGSETFLQAHHRLSSDTTFTKLKDTEISANFEIESVTDMELLARTASKSVLYQMKKEVLERWDWKKIYHPQMHEVLPELLTWVYPYASASRLHTKMTVSQLKQPGQFMDDQDTYHLADVWKAETESQYMEIRNKENPDTGEPEDKYSGTASGTGQAALRGIAVHKVMEKIDLSTIHSPEDVNRFLSDLVRGQWLTEEARSLVHPWPIYRFAKSELARRMLLADQAGQLHRESQFVIGVRACDVIPGQTENETILIQGIVDAWFVEDGQVVIVDYKTDYVPDEGQCLVEKYRKQLDYYGMAIHQSTGLSVKEKLIYAMGIGKVLRVD